MAFGPYCADTVQRYILQTLNDHKISKLDFDELINPERSFNGQEKWSVGEVFDDEALQTFDETELERPENGLRALDQIYDALKTTQKNNKKLEGLRAMKIGWDLPFEEGSKTHWKWCKQYREAGLIDDNDELTPEASIFLETDPRGYKFDNIGVEDVGEVYKTLVTSDYNDTDKHNGRKIEALFLYGGGLNHKQVSEEVGIHESTLRHTTEQLEDMGILTQDYMLRQEGYEFGQMVIDQLEGLIQVTSERLEENSITDYDGLDNFEGNVYMAKSLLAASENSF